MTRQYGRNRRVADLVQRELAALLQRKLTDPKLGLVTVSAVDISPDLKNARVYVTSLGGELDADKLVGHLNDTAGYYRHELAGALTLRTVPQLQFAYDVSIQRGRHLTDLIDSLSAASDQDTASDGA